MPGAASVRSLSQAVRPRVVGRWLGELLRAAALTVLPPLAVGLALGERRVAGVLALVGVVLLAAGELLRRLRGAPRLQANEGLVVTALAFGLVALAMSAPFAAAGIGWVDALFESVSGVTTTGLSTLGTCERLSSTLLFTRAWMQWYGGLGIAVLCVALLAGPGLAARRLGVGDEAGGLVESARAYARRVAAVYVVLTTLGFALLVVSGLGLLDALVHALAAVSTGGFGTRDASLAGLGGTLTPVVVLVLCFAGAISLPRYAELRRKGWKVLARDLELRLLVVGVLVTAALLGLVLVAREGRPLGEAAWHAPLLAVSAQTTAGFSTLEVGRLDPAGQLVLVLAMLAGGSVGSTAGGVKLLRLAIAFQLVAWLVRRARMPPHAVHPPSVAGVDLEAQEAQRALATILLFAAALVASWLVFVLCGRPAMASLFEVASALGTVGLSAGEAGPQLADGLKLVLCADMLLGRLEVLAVLVLVLPRTWVGRRTG
jgi:trk system potassium uptake protein TrkH